MPTKKSKTIPKDEGYVFPSKGKKITAEEVASAFGGKSVSFDAHDITSKIIEFGKILTGLSLYKYQEEAVYAIIYSVITFSGDVKTMLFSRQSGKCFDPHTKVRMADMSVRKIKDVNVGDYVMGVNGVPRKVLEKHDGYSEMYKVRKRTNYGKTYIVNGQHELVFRERLKSGGYADRVMSVEDYLKEPLWKRKDAYIGYRSAVDFAHQDALLEPYFLGVWLGDGRCDSQAICTPDTPVIDYLREYAEKLGYKVSLYSQGEEEVAHSYAITKTEGKSNYILQAFRKYNLVDNKHIPLEYLHNDRKTRLEVLAGIIDSDGHHSPAKGKERTIEITFRSRKLARGVQYLAQSLGFRCSLSSKRATIKELGFECVVYRLNLYGALWEIPIKVERKKISKGTLREEPLHYGFDVVPNGVGEYVGIQVDGDNLFLLDDFTVVHNSEAMAFIIDTLCTLLPALGKIIPDLEQFSTGFRVGLFAPQSDQVQTTYSRAMTRINSANAEMVLSDPDIDVWLESAARLELSNGSYLAGQVASKQSKIESKTYDMVIVEEAQDVDDLIVSKSVEPMLSSTAGTLIKVGTTGMYKNHFWYEIQHNRQLDRKVIDPRIRNHFEFDYKRIIKDRREQYEKDGKRFHLNYEADILRKKSRWGEDSQSFKLAYALIWDLESGMLLTDKEFNGIINRKMGYQMPSNTDYVVAGLDIGKSPAETVLTIARVFHLEDQFDKPYKQILAWVALGGMDYEAQHHAILDCIVEFNISAIFADYTGVGKAVVDRLMYACGEYVDITPYTFTSQSKSDMWFNFVSEIQTRHLIVPANKKVRSTTEFMKFEEQMKNCQKYFNGAYMVCEKSEGYFDDFVDSAALMCLAANEEQKVDEEMEVTTNNLYGGVSDTINAIRRHSY